jgi:hypothetical protein
MDSNLTVKPRDSVARTGLGRTSVVRTDLAPSQSVTAAKPVDNTHVPLVETVLREPVINPQSQELLNRERERERERRAARRAADEALMRQRAYGRPAASAAASEEPEQDSHADLQV